MPSVQNASRPQPTFGWAHQRQPHFSVRDVADDTSIVRPFDAAYVGQQVITTPLLITEPRQMLLQDPNPSKCESGSSCQIKRINRSSGNCIAG
jgi:hypothetical protein